MFLLSLDSPETRRLLSAVYAWWCDHEACGRQSLSVQVSHCCILGQGNVMHNLNSALLNTDECQWYELGFLSYAKKSLKQ